MRMILGAAAALGFMATPAWAYSPYQSDPRIELLGVIQYLSGARPDLPMDEDYRAAVAKRFAAFVGHPVVARWKDSGESWAIDVLCLSEPPELAPGPRCPSSGRLSAAEFARWRGFLAAARDFARKSDFMKFYDGRRSDYRRICAAAAAALGPKDPVDATEKYLGLTLDLDARWIVSPLFVSGPVNANISPYPNPATLPDPGQNKFLAATLIAYAAGPLSSTATVITQNSRAAAWRLPLLVFAEPAMSAFSALKSTATTVSFNKDDLVSALTQRLEGPSAPPSAATDDAEAMLLHRLAEYESNRLKWPTLWDFFPRLAGAPEIAPANPIKRVKDLYPARRAARK